MKQIFTILLILGLTSCMSNYTTTSFYVKNTSTKTLNFKASIVKYTSAGPIEMTLPFSVPPNDSVLARKVGLRNDSPPTAWFTSFIIFPTDSVAFNNPNIPSNWKKSTDIKGKPVYTFNLNK